jgi:hypothetical protein
MKSAILLAVAVVIVSSLPVVLRHAEASAQEGATAQATGMPGNRPAAVIAKVRPKSSGVSGSAYSNTDVRPVNRESADKIDATSSKTESPKSAMPRD